MGFIDLMIHHVFTIIVVLAGYYMNLENMTVYGLLLTNISDTFINLGRYLRDIKARKLFFWIGVFFLYSSFLLVRVIGIPFGLISSILPGLTEFPDFQLPIEHKDYW